MTAPFQVDSHSQLRERIARTYASVNTVENVIAKIDLLKLHKNILNLWAKLDNEMIACRTWRRLSPAYLDLAKDIESRLTYMDKHIMWSRLG